MNKGSTQQCIKRIAPFRLLRRHTRDVGNNLNKNCNIIENGQTYSSINQKIIK